ncbi:DUF2199 domain-containing protein [Rugamonas aquatica]|uniref:DUF2199 domain-containing protein n=1 Tax=Rugamonas aquatica TaxID=2743357 RepID=A0A6A7N1Y9_9BURK|nr:DUF2199 domain-containing protein [Rugamonas aquatica]MQA38848.1 DUF2199 domain-containing protein [Rugamonas aquatica]
MFSFKCASCGEVHEGMPSFDAHAPLSYYEVPEGEREERCDLGSDDCVVDGEFFFVRGCIEIPVLGETEPFSWGVWVSLSEANFSAWIKCYDLDNRSHVGPFFGWLNAWLKPYPDTVSLKTMVHIRDNGIRPYIELQPTDHPLAVEQRNGITVERVAELYALMMHPVDK